jgi:hypothetical protein
MRGTRVRMLATVLVALTWLPGCSRYVVDIEPAGSLFAEHQPSRKGNIHILPIEKGPMIFDLEKGVTNLDQRWAVLHQKAQGTADSDAVKPSKFVTTADLTRVMQGRTISALRQAGFRVTEGDYIPSEADIIIVQSLQVAFVSLSGPSCPSAAVQVWTHSRNVQNGANTTNLIVGHGRSFDYVTLGQGLEAATEGALDEYLTKLVQDTKDDLAYLVEFRDRPLRSSTGPREYTWNRKPARLSTLNR